MERDRQAYVCGATRAGGHCLIPGWGEAGRERLTEQDRQQRGGSGKAPGLPWVPLPLGAPPPHHQRPHHFSGSAGPSEAQWAAGGWRSPLVLISSGPISAAGCGFRGLRLMEAAARPRARAVFAEISAVTALPLCVHRGHLAAQTPAAGYGTLSGPASSPRGRVGRVTVAVTGQSLPVWGERWESVKRACGWVLSGP